MVRIHELVTLVYESKLLMYYRCLLDDTLRSSWSSPQSDNLFSQSSRLSYPSKPHALGAFCYTQILSPTCYEILNPYVFPKSQTWSGKLALDINSTWKYLAPRFPFGWWVVPCSAPPVSCSWGLLLVNLSHSTCDHGILKNTLNFERYWPKLFLLKPPPNT